jgi:hypothetical protein
MSAMIPSVQTIAILAKKPISSNRMPMMIIRFPLESRNAGFRRRTQAAQGMTFNSSPDQAGVERHMEPPHLPQVADHGIETVDDEELHRDGGGFLSGEADVQDEVTEPQVEHSAAGPVHDECQQNDGQNDGHHPDEEQHDARDGIARYCSGSRHNRQLPRATRLIRRQNPMPI